MIVPIVCWTDGCPNRGTEVNRVSDLNPQGNKHPFRRLAAHRCNGTLPLCKELGVAENPLIEHEGELKYFDDAGTDTP